MAGRFRPWLPAMPGGPRMVGPRSKQLPEQLVEAEARAMGPLRNLQRLMWMIVWRCCRGRHSP